MSLAQDFKKFAMRGNVVDMAVGIIIGGAFGTIVKSLVAEYQAIRASTLALFHHLPADAPERVGNANGAEVSVRALLYIITGHERHHARVLRERYL